MKRLSKLLALVMLSALMITMLAACGGVNVDGTYYKYDGKKYDTTEYYTIKGTGVEYHHGTDFYAGQLSSKPSGNMSSEPVIFKWDNGTMTTLNYIKADKAFQAGVTAKVSYKKK